VFSESYELNVGTAVTVNVAIFWDVAPFIPYGTYRLHLQGRKSAKQETIVRQVASVHTRTTRRYIPEDGSVYELNVLILYKRV
jgi:hypothetical protein